MKRLIALLLALMCCTCCGEEIADLLTKLGYEGDSAVWNFQRANGLNCTGTADAATVERLKSPDAVTLDEYLSGFYTVECVTAELRSGDTGSGVERLQARLKDLGYYEGVPSGVYDDATIVAVATFEYYNNITMDGEADSGMLSLLVSAFAVKKPSDAEIYELALGAEGMQVKELQIALQKLGYYEGALTGYFGTKTEAAVLEFQKENCLTEDGSWNLHMQLLVNNGYAISKAAAQEQKANLVLERGMTDKCVKELEDALGKLGYFNSSSDDYFDDDTVQAVKICQSACGLEITGIADAETRLRLSEGSVPTYGEYEEQALQEPLEVGETGYGVYLCSKRLGELGYPLTAQWTYDAEMKDVVDKFKRAAGIECEGMNYAARQLLNSEDAPTYNEALLKIAELNELENRNTLWKTALNLVGMPYEAGQSGPDSFGAAGLICYCAEQAGLKLEPTVSMQLESAYAQASFSTNPEDVCASRQVFYRNGETVLTGIYTEYGTVVRSSEQYGVIEVDFAGELTRYEFIGSVDWF